MALLVAGVVAGAIVLDGARSSRIVTAASLVPGVARVTHRGAVRRHGALGPAAAVARLLSIGLPVFCGGLRGRYVALTFDDGPGPYTQLALRILKSASASATFFLVGKELAYFSRLPTLEAKSGALGDHTWSHSFLPGLKPQVIASELARTKSVIIESARTRVDLFRPPYGAYNAAVNKAARSLGLVEILWSIDTRDSEGAPWFQIADTVARNVRPGSIVLMHENHGQTIRALKFRILPMLRARHFIPVTVPQLLALQPPTRAQLLRGSNGCGHPWAPRTRQSP